MVHFSRFLLLTLTGRVADATVVQEHHQPLSPTYILTPIDNRSNVRRRVNQVVDLVIELMVI